MVNSCALPFQHYTHSQETTIQVHSMVLAKAFKMINKSDEYKMLFASFRNSFTFEASIFLKIEEFVCELHGLPTCTNTDKARYIKFYSSKNRLPEQQQLPPTRYALLCHCKRVSYVTAIIKGSMIRCPKITSPQGHGWYLKNKSKFSPSLQIIYAVSSLTIGFGLIIFFILVVLVFSF